MNIKHMNIKEDIKNRVGVIEPTSEQKYNTETGSVGMFQVRGANERMMEASKQPVPRRLWKDTSLIFENEMTLLFASTGLGKTVLSVQMANDMAKTDKVLYLDLELSDVQFRKRYSDNFTDDFQFNENLFIVNFQRRFSIPDGIDYDTYFLDSLKTLLDETGAKIVFVDNMTRLISSDTDQAKSAKPLMDKLNAMKFDYGLTMILIEHSRKTDNLRPISINDLQGSKMKVNFADAVFTIGQSSKDKNLRYVKQLKVRSSELDFDSENVVLYELVQKNSFLQFDFVGYGDEREHLKEITDKDRIDLERSIIEMKAAQPSASYRDIAKSLGTNRMKVKRTLDNLSETVTPVTPVTPVTLGTVGTVGTVGTHKAQESNAMPF
jgi:KaiC/GvpD/RAD55 family RecA-like ATPase